MKINRVILCVLLPLCSAVAFADQSATIVFNKDAVRIDGDVVTAEDSQGNEWTITTTGTASYTANTSYYQVGSSNIPASSIVFTTTLTGSAYVKDVCTKFGGFSNTKGNVTISVDEEQIGSGSLNGTSDVTVSSTSGAAGNTLTISITGIAKGVKCYNISYTYLTETVAHEVVFSVNGDLSEPMELYEGAKVVFPDVESGVEGKRFVGWTKEAIDGVRYDDVEVLKSATMGKEDAMYYAVYASVTNGIGYTYTPTLVTGKNYMLVAANAAGSAYILDAGNLSTTATTSLSGVKLTSVEVEQDGEEVFISKAPNATSVWTSSGSATSLKLTNGGKWMKINSSGIALSESSSTVYWDNTYGLYGKTSAGKALYSKLTSIPSLSFSSSSGSETARLFLFVEEHRQTYSAFCTSLEAVDAVDSIEKHTNSFSQKNYDVLGRQYNSNMKGIHIVNGKKIIKL